MKVFHAIVISAVTILSLQRTKSENIWKADDDMDTATNSLVDDVASDDITDEQTAKEKNTKSQEGDMKVTKLEELAEKGKINMDMPLEDLDKWPTTTIPYVFAKKFNGQRAIKAAFEEYRKKSCIRFRPKTPQDEDFLYFYNGRGCWSFVGRIGGKQHVSLPHYCRTTLGTPVHEILHALGFYHEQSRTDRDKYIEVEWENIKPRAKQNFEEHQSQDHGYPYDYESVMHYSDHSFSRNGKKTLKVLKGHHIIGQRFGMSKIDAAQLNAHYCGGKWGSHGKKEIIGASIHPNSKRVVMCNPEEGEVCEDMNTDIQSKKQIFDENVVKKEKMCNPEEGEVCEDMNTLDVQSKKQILDENVVKKEKMCNPEEGEVCDETDDCTSLFKDGQCYKCSVAKKCSSCVVDDVKENCSKWASKDFCTKPNYRNWMSINCATSCKGKCKDE